MTGFPMLPYWEFDRWREMGRVQRIIDLRSPWQYEKERIHQDSLFCSTFGKYICTLSIRFLSILSTTRRMPDSVVIPS